MNNFKLPFIGREKELRLLEDSVSSILGGESRTILIKGEVGIGKSELLEKFKQELKTPPFQIFHLSGYHGSKSTYPLDSVVSSYFLSIENRTAKLAKFINAADLANIASVDEKILEYYPYEVKTRKDVPLTDVYDSIIKFLGNLAAVYPVLMLFDDIHWLSSISHEFLDYLLPRIQNLPILIILTLDNAESPHSPDYSGRVDEIINLDKLDQQQVKTALETMDHHAGQISFVTWLFKFTQGNPYFIEQLLVALNKMNILKITDQGWQIEDFYQDFPVPDNLGIFFKKKIMNYSQDELIALRGAALIGESFTLIQLQEILKNFNIQGIKKIIGKLNQEQVINLTKQGNFEFSHPLIRKVILDYIPVDQRRSIHRKIAEYLEKNDPQQIEEIVYHRTNLLLPEEYSFELLQQVRKCFTKYTYFNRWTKAKHYLKIILAISKNIPDVDEKLKVDLKMDEYHVRRYSGERLPDWSEGKQIFEDLLKFDMVNRAQFFISMYIREMIDVNNFKQAEKLYQKSMDIIKPEDLVSQWRVRYNHCVMLVKQDKFKQAQQKAKKLVEDVDAKVLKIGKWFPLNLLGGISYHLGDLKKALEYYQQSLNIAQEVNIKGFCATNYGNLALVLKEMGKVDQAIDFANQELDLIAEIGNIHKKAEAFNLLSSCYLVKKNFSFARMYAQRFMKLAEIVDVVDMKIESYLKMMKVYEMENNTEKLKDCLNKFREKFSFDQIRSTYQCDFLVLCACEYLEKEEIEKALQCVDQGINIAQKDQMKLIEANLLKYQAICYLKMKKSKKAWDSFYLAEKLFKKYHCLVGLTELYFEFGQYISDKQGKIIVNQGIKLLSELGLDESLKYYQASLASTGKAKLIKLFDEYIENQQIKPEFKPVNGIYTFGGLYVKDIRLKEVLPEKKWGSKKAKELLGLLLVMSGEQGVTREVLSTHLWPEMGVKESQNNFHVTLSYLRKFLGSEAITCGEPFYKLNSQLFYIDYVDFTQSYQDYLNCKRKGLVPKAEQKALHALKLYKSDFLPEMYSLPIDDEQILLKENIKEIILWLIEINEQRLDWREVLNYAHRLLEIDATDERAHRAVLQAFSGMEDRNGMIKHYQRMSKILQDELDVQPEKKTEELYKKLSAKK
ncbi:MAG: AAA family ATPase [bacterium]